ncbi:MAG: terminase small subunit [Deltaproteobacteria bacterium]|nr:terminase small subunit [Deltaproteobacteria bacterium]
MKRKLTALQERFVLEYLKELNATKACIRAGYKHPDIGKRLATKSHVQERIHEIMEKINSERIADIQEVAERYTRDIRFDPRKLLDENGNFKDIKDLDDDIAMSLAGFEIHESIKEDAEGGGNAVILHRRLKYKFPDRIRALDSLGKYLGMFKGDPEKGDGLLSENLMVICARIYNAEFRNSPDSTDDQVGQ